MKIRSTFTKRLISLALVAAVTISPGATYAQGNNQPWMNTSLSSEERTELLLEEMTMQEKVDFVTGNVNNYYGFYNKGNERLGIPALQMADGPAGVRIANPDVQDKKSTAMPSPIALAASWDVNAAKQYGNLIGNEAYNTTHNVVLGPGFDIARLPWGARNFESLGEDPLLQAKLGAAYVEGVQQNPVMATAKHFLMNNQETERFTTNAKVSDRAIQEIYLRPFEEAIKKSDLSSVMCSFNKINGTNACENEKLLNNVLKDQLNFQGFVMSDYGANMSTESANSGLDMETPGEPWGSWGGQLLTAVNNGTVKEERLDDMASRILTQMFDKGLFDNKVKNEAIPASQHGAKARELAENSMVLMKNEDSILPLNNKKLDSIAVIGPDADNASAAGGGSSLVNPTYTVSPLEGIKKRAGGSVKVDYAPGTDPISAGDILSGPSAVASSVLTNDEGTTEGLTAEYWTNQDFEGEPKLKRTDGQVNLNLGFYNFEGFNAQSPKLPTTPTDFNGNSISARWTGYITAPKSGEYVLSLTSLGSSKLYIDGELAVNNKGTKLETTKKTFSLTEGEQHQIKIEYKTDYPKNTQDLGAQVRFGWEPPAETAESKLQEAVDLAKKSDVAVVVTRTYESEGYTDPSNLDLPNNQDRLIQAVSKANPNTIVVQMSGRAVEMTNWQDDVPAIVQAWFGGQEQGNAVARVLFGDVNPSGKLPVTFPVDETKTPVSSEAQFPGINGEGDYSEGIYVGYRGYEKSGIIPAYSFGHGLSYTTFDYRNLKVKANGANGAKSESPVTVSLNLRNTGKVKGSEVVQVYVGKLPTKIDTPSKQLAGFTKVELGAGKQKRVNIDLDPKALSYWDEQKHEWVMPTGKVNVYVGSSSDDLILTGQVQIKPTSNKGNNGK